LISLVLLAQFGLFYWRALMAGFAAAPLSERVWQASGIPDEPVEGEHLRLLLNVSQLCPDLGPKGRSTTTVRLYSRMIAALGWLSRKSSPALAAWTDREMSTCARYVAVVLDQRLERNGARLAEILSY
jgi:hypothetical protein